MQDPVPVQTDQMVRSQVISVNDITVENNDSLGNPTAAGAVFVVESTGIDACEPVVLCYHVSQQQARLLYKFI